MTPSHQNAFRTALLALLLAAAANAQPADAPPPAEPPSPAPTDHAAHASVVEVTGLARFAPLGIDRADRAAWKKLEVGLNLPPETQILTGINTTVVLQFQDHTVLVVESASLVALNQLSSDEAADAADIGLGYGAVRAGTAETARQTSLTIQTPNAVLSKEGTQGIRFQYNSGTGELHVSLAESGMLELQKDAYRRKIRPGQFVTQAMVPWIKNATFGRNVNLADRLAITEAELRFLSSNRGVSTALAAGPLAGSAGLAASPLARGQQQILRNLSNGFGPSTFPSLFDRSRFRFRQPPAPTPVTPRDGQFGTPANTGPRIGDLVRAAAGQ